MGGRASSSSGNGPNANGGPAADSVRLSSRASEEESDTEGASQLDHIQNSLEAMMSYDSGAGKIPDAYQQGANGYNKWKSFALAARTIGEEPPSSPEPSPSQSAPSPDPGGPKSGKSVSGGWAAVAARGHASASPQPTKPPPTAPPQSQLGPSPKSSLATPSSPPVLLSPQAGPPTAKAAAASFVAAVASMAVANQIPMPVPAPAPHHASQQHQLMAAAIPQTRTAFNNKTMSRLSPRFREEITTLINSMPGLKIEDFDDGVMYQLCQKRNEDEAIAALRALSGSNLANMQHVAAYLNHVIKNFRLLAPGEGGQASTSVSSIRTNRLEEIVNKCGYMDWKHLDAGVIKVMSQLSDIGETDILEELNMLESSDLSNVEYMPAYLNKRLNNRLWSRRKAMGVGTGYA
eukprot:gene22531-29654_t